MADQKWVDVELSPPTIPPALPITNPLAAQLGQWLSRPQSVIPPELVHGVKNRMIMGESDQDTTKPPGDRFLETLRGAVIFLSKTGSKNDGQRALALLTLVRRDNNPSGRAGRMESKSVFGDPIHCVDYTSQAVSLGPLRWVGG